MNIENRKNYTKNKVIKIKELLISIFGDKHTAGWFSTICLHYGPHLIFLILLLILPFNFLFIIPWLLGYCLHMFFKGCIHLRLERACFDDRDWVGPYHMLEYLGIDTSNKQNITTFLHIALIIFAGIFLIKFINYKYSDTPNNIFYTDNPFFWIYVSFLILQFIGFLLI